MNYRYHLKKYAGKSSRLTCPSCGRPHCFSPYVDDNEEMYGEEYGRCDHESSCGYVKYPPSDYDPLKRYSSSSNSWRNAPSGGEPKNTQSKSVTVKRPDPKPEPEGGICEIPFDIVRQTVRTKPLSNFLRFLLTILPKDTIISLVKDYYIGVTKSLEAVFYQIDIQGRCRSGKIVNYNPETGHRIKSEESKPPVTWVHSKLKQAGKLPDKWELTQCLFGEHLLAKYPDKIVILVEAEKTAIIGAAINPKFVWVATGGKGQVGDKLDVLEGRQIVAFPDYDGYDEWKRKFEEQAYLNIHISDYVQKHATQEEKESGADIADLVIRWLQEHPNYGPLSLKLPLPEALRYDNPVMQEVMKYISPEHWDDVNSLITELDLELVGVTKIGIVSNL